MKLAVFLDTMIYLHYEPFDQIDWLYVLDADLIEIVVPPVTVRELNKNKELHTHRRVRGRAARVQKSLLAMFLDEQRAGVRDSVEMVLEDREPQVDWEEYQLLSKVQDDNLIASILFYRRDNPRTETVLVTSDEGLALIGKARRLGIQCVTLADDLRLPAEPDPAQARIRDLESKIRQLMSRSPDLSLAFDNGDQHSEFELPTPLRLSEPDINSRLEDVRKRYPKMNADTGVTKELPMGGGEISVTIGGAMFRSWDVISPEQLSEYNSELDRFHDDYARFLERDGYHENVQRRTLNLRIYILNRGTAPAEDIDVFMHFPGGFELRSAEDLPGRPSPPRAPAKPKTMRERFVEGATTSLDMPYIGRYLPEVSLPDGSAPNVSAPQIRQTDSYEVNVQVARLKHGIREQLEPLLVVFESHEEARPFHIDYEMMVGNISETVRGRLDVIVRREGEP